jgi:hypothetical protein
MTYVIRTTRETRNEHAKPAKHKVACVSGCVSRVPLTFSRVSRVPFRELNPLFIGISRVSRVLWQFTHARRSFFLLIMRFSQLRPLMMVRR